MTSSSPLRMVWTPRSGTTTAAKWWPGNTGTEAPPLIAIRDIALFDPGVKVSDHDGIIEATWRDSSWQSALGESQLTMTVAPRELRITVPAVWRAHAYFGWRDGRLLISSDLRTLATAMPASRPAPEGIAAFLAGNRAVSGIVQSLYSGVWEVQPGHVLVVGADAQVHCHRAWTPERHEEFASQPLEVATKQVRAHLEELAERILGRHDRVACLFSGGLDSTLVAATLLRRAPRQVVLFNVGSNMGTAAEVTLRARFLHDFDTVSRPVDLPADAGLVRSLRATNAVAALPAGSLFAHVFEEIIAAARGNGCDVIVTGDGGDEVFAEREEILVDLLAGRSRSLLPTVGYFALRNGERGTQTLRRAVRHLQALSEGRLPSAQPEPGDGLLGEDLAQLVATARTGAAIRAGELWAAGWTCSGLGSYRRAAAVPEWEPVSADVPSFPVISPLADATIAGDALALRRDAVVARLLGGQPKWLLRQAALDWLSPEIALHPKIGSTDAQILTRVRSHEHHELLDLLGSGTACSLGLSVSAAAENLDSPLWYSDGWIRAAALVAWFDQANPPPRTRPVIALAAAAPANRLTEIPIAEQYKPVRVAAWRVTTLTVLNLVAQLAPDPRTRQRASEARPRAYTASDNSLTRTLVDLARRACAVPFVNASSQVMSRALAWYLRLTGERPIVVRGSAKSHWTTQYWIEVDGSVVDVSGAESPLVPDED